MIYQDVAGFNYRPDLSESATGCLVRKATPMLYYYSQLTDRLTWGGLSLMDGVI